MSERKLFALALFLICLHALSPCVRAQTADRAKAAAEIESLREQIKARESALLSVSPEDQERCAQFLSHPHTGLVRLLPREQWDGKLSMRGGGSYYSFTRLSNEYGRATDIGLEQDKFLVGFAGADFGFISNLGDLALEAVTDETEAVQFMASFKAPLAEAEAREAGRSFWPARLEGQWTYTRMLPVAVNKTYAVRSVVYDDSDVLVAFRVLRKDTDGSVVILWKMLKKFPKPTLQRSAAATAGQ
jgi:hypothetical protein